MRSPKADQCPTCFRFHVPGIACPYPTSWVIPENRIDRIERGDYIVVTNGAGRVHWQPNPRFPVAACGVDFTGTFATRHPITDGAAFNCDECADAWRAAHTNEPGAPT